MKTYGIYIKSHCEAVDYEDEVEARSKEEAAELFSSRLPRVEGNDWEAVDLMPFIGLIS